jgi:hypothetical protein
MCSFAPIQRDLDHVLELWDLVEVIQDFLEIRIEVQLAVACERTVYYSLEELIDSIAFSIILSIFRFSIPVSFVTNSSQTWLDGNLYPISDCIVQNV